MTVPIAVRRLHDRDRSGSWLLVFYGLPAFLGYLAGTGETGWRSVLALASLAISIWGFVEMGCLRGTVGPNEYGPDPLAKV